MGLLLLWVKILRRYGYSGTKAEQSKPITAVIAVKGHLKSFAQVAEEILIS